MAQTWSSALLDCGASKKVCSKEWLNQDVKNLDKNSQQNILFEQNNHVYRFGDATIKTTHSTTTPATTGKEPISIKTDTLGSDKPLLFA